MPEHTIFVITTDGMENASRRYTGDEVKRMVKHEKEKYGWEFLFLGANIDAIREASRFGIPARTGPPTTSTTARNQKIFGAISRAISGAGGRASAAEMNAYFDAGEPMEEIREDYRRRGGK